MSSIRIKKVRAPLAYVPLEQGQVAVVPTDKLPSPEHRDSPANHEFLMEHAQGLVGTSSASVYSAPRPERAALIPPSTTRRRSKTLGAVESEENSALADIRFTLPASNSQRRSRSGSSSWFVDHVNPPVGSSSGRPVLQIIPSQAPPPLSQELSSTHSNVTLEVVIPEEVRVGLAGTLQDNNSSLDSLESEIHPDDIVDHLSVIGTPSIRYFTTRKT